METVQWVLSPHFIPTLPIAPKISCTLSLLDLCTCTKFGPVHLRFAVVISKKIDFSDPQSDYNMLKACYAAFSLQRCICTISAIIHCHITGRSARYFISFRCILKTELFVHTVNVDSLPSHKPPLIRLQCAPNSLATRDISSTENQIVLSPIFVLLRKTAFKFSN